LDATEGVGICLLAVSHRTGWDGDGTRRAWDAPRAEPISRGVGYNLRRVGAN
jgi:hypothetical protein